MESTDEASARTAATPLEAVRLLIGEAPQEPNQGDLVTFNIGEPGWQSTEE
jgi:hypothetical protein